MSSTKVFIAPVVVAASAAAPSGATISASASPTTVWVAREMTMGHANRNRSRSPGRIGRRLWGRPPRASRPTSSAPRGACALLPPGILAPSRFHVERELETHRRRALGFRESRAQESRAQARPKASVSHVVRLSVALNRRHLDGLRIYATCDIHREREGHHPGQPWLAAARLFVAGAKGAEANLGGPAPARAEATLDAARAQANVRRPRRIERQGRRAIQHHRLAGWFEGIQRVAQGRRRVSGFTPVGSLLRTSP